MPEKSTLKDNFAPITQLRFDRTSEGIPILNEDIKLDIAEHVYYLRDATGQTQEEFGELVGVEPSVIDDLEEWDYEGDALAMLAHIEKSLRRHVEAPIKPGETVYPNALLTATITGLKYRLFRYHIGRKATPVNGKGFRTTLQDKQYILNELEPWQEALQRNKDELRMFALAGMTEWCHLDGTLRGNFSGDPNEYLQAAAGHNALINALGHYIQTGERTALKQWRQNIGELGEVRYVNELEAALQQKLFEEFPDTEWLVQTLLGFLKMSAL